MSEMTIIEGLKKLKMLERRMSTNITNINKYAAQLSNERLYFSDEARQRSEIMSLIQANKDLMLEYLNLKARVDTTNNLTTVTIGKHTHTIATWLVILRKMGAYMKGTYNALNSDNVKTSRFGVVDKDVKLIRFYSEQDKNDGLREWDDLLQGEIEGRLEVVNATTKLL